MPLKIPTVQVGLEKSIQKAVKNVSARGGLNLSLDDKNFTRPLGKITGSVSEFNKSLEASNARVLAFGASVGIIQGVQNAFKALLQTTIQVEKQLTEINIVMGLTNSQLDNFSKELFKVAKNTAQSFSTVATAATELARQGLTMEETLRRTNDALILTRLTGLDAASAVSGLTAALNTFNKAGLDSTKILSKMAAVDVQFAVSTEDLIDAVSRAGAVAQDAGVSFDQLLGAVTAAQQQTARGGKVIGNSFKTIFTRVQRSSTINRLEELGIAVRDMAGNTLPAITVLENLAKTYENLADTTKAAVAEQVGGVFQINILKAAIKDLSEENSILARATQISASATDEAYKKNEILNRSLSALTSQTASSIKELANLIGDVGFSDQIRDYLTFIRDQLSSINTFLGQKEGESAGADFANGLIKGIGNVISGPGLVLAAGVLVRLFATTSKFLIGSAKELMGVVSASQKQQRVQESIVAILGENSNLQKRILSQEGNRAAQEKTILTLLQAQAREQQRIAAAAKAVGPAILRSGFNTSLQKTRSGGHVPNYASPEEKILEKQGAIAGGYQPGAVRSLNIKGRGRVVYNTAEKVKQFDGMSEPAIMPPKNSKAGKSFKQKFENIHGFNPYANKGIIPNYSAFDYDKSLMNTLILNNFGKNGRIKYLDALNYIDDKGLKELLNSFAKNMDQDVEWKASWPGMSINDLSKKFPHYAADDPYAPPGDINRGLYKGLTNSRIKEILQQDGIQQSFYKYLKGKSSGIDIENFLTKEEKDFFMSEFGSLPRLKHVDDGSSPGGRKANLNAFQDDFLTTKAPKGESPLKKIEKKFRATISSEMRRSDLLQQNKALKPEEKQILGLPFDPNRKHIDPSVYYAKPGDYSRAQHMMLEKQMEESQTGAMKGAVTSSIRTKGFSVINALADKNLTMSKMQNMRLIEEFEYLMNPPDVSRVGQSGAIIKGPAFDPYSFSQAEDRIRDRLRVHPRIQRYFKGLMKKSMARWGFSQGMIPNYGLKINPANISRLGMPKPSELKRKNNKNIPRPQHVIGMTELDQIIRSGLFKSIKYHPLKGGPVIDVNNARYGVHSLKKGASPPKGFSSWDDFDQNNKLGRTRVVYTPPKREGESPFKRLRLDRIESVNHRGQIFKVDPNMAASGLIPNFAKFRVKTQQFGGEDGPFGPPRQVQFSSFIGDKKFVKSQATEIDDPKQPGKTGLQVIFTGESDTSLRGKGYGRQLYEFMARYAKKKGYTGLYGDMTTSKSAMRVIDSIAKKGKFKIEKNKDLKFSKDELEPEGNWGSDSWTYRMSNQGHVPNYAGLFSKGAENILSKNLQYAGAVSDAIKREASFGLTPKVVEAPSLKSSKNPGLAVVNKEQESGSLQKAKMLHGGLNPNQKSAAVPNYALDLSDVIQVRKGADDLIDERGLNSVSNSFEKSTKIINHFSTELKGAQKILKTLGKGYAESSEFIKEANLREKARLGILDKESKERKQYAREFLRKDALGMIAQRGGAIGGLATQLQQSSNFEKDLKFRMGVAEFENDFETLKGLEKLDQALDESAQGMFNNPETKASILRNQLREESRQERGLRRFQGQEGFSKKEMRKFFAQEFLENKGINTKDIKEAESIMSKMDARGNKEFRDFAKSRGVTSSNAALARGGLKTGDFRNLIGANDGSSFMTQLANYQKIYDEGGKGKIAARRRLMREAAKIAKDSDSAEQLQSMVLNTESKPKSEKKSGSTRTDRSRVASGGFLKGVGGSFTSGVRGSSVRSQGFFGSLANRTGRAVGNIGTGTRNFATRGFGAAGGQVGLGLSIAAPMLAGMVSNRTAREDRAVLQNGQFNVQGRGSDIASSTLMGVGMGAIFGAPGAVVGGVIGFISSLKEATLTIDEQIRVREKEIALIGQNINATQSVQNLSSARAEAFAQGDQNKIAEIDVAMNRALAGVTDKETLKRLSAAGSDNDALAEIQRDLQDQMTNAVSVQNFGVALKNSDQEKAARNAGVAMGSMIAQSIRNENVDESSALDALRRIQTSTAEKESRGMMDTASLNALRKKATGVLGQQDLLSTGGVSGGIAGGIAGGLMATGGVLSATGLGLPVGLLMAAAGAGIGLVGGRMTETYLAKGDLAEQTEMGLDEINELNKLVEAGALTENAMNQLVAAFREGEISMGDIAKEAEDAVVEFQKIKKASDRASAALFNIDQTFKRTIQKLSVNLEVNKIRQNAQSSAEKSNANFSSQFLSPIDASKFLAREQSRILSNEANSRISNFQSEGEIAFLRQVQSKSKQLNFGGPQMEFIRKTVENQGTAPIESMIRRREMSGTMTINLSTQRLDDIFEAVGIKGGVDNFSQGDQIKMPENVNDMKDLLGTSRAEEQSRIMQEIINNLPKVKAEGTMDTTFTRNLEEPDAQTLSEILDAQRERYRIIQETILAERKNLSIQIAQNTIQTKIQQDLSKLQQQANNTSLSQEGSMMQLRGQASSALSFSNFRSQSPLFRGMSSDEEENKRQAGLRKKNFEEEMKVRKAEALNTFKKEATRLLAEKELINALNNLKQAIDEQLDIAESEGNQVSQGENNQLVVKPIGPNETSGAGAGTGAASGRGISVIPTMGGSKELNKKIEEESKAVSIAQQNIETNEGKTKKQEGIVSDLDTRIEQLTKLKGRLENIKNLDEGGFFSNIGLQKSDQEAERDAIFRELKKKSLIDNMGDITKKVVMKTGMDEGGSYQYAEQQDKTDVEIANELGDIINKAKSNRENANRKKEEAKAQVEKFKKEVEDRRKNIALLNDTFKEDVIVLSDKLAGENISLEDINLNATSNLIDSVNSSTSLEQGAKDLNENLKDLAGSDETIALKLGGLNQVVNNLNIGIQEFERNFNVQEALRAVEEFNQTLKFSTFSTGSFDQLRDIRNQNQNIEAVAGASVMNKVVDQERRQQNFDIVNRDPTSTSLDRARAKAELNAFTIGTKQQRDQMVGMRDRMRDENLLLTQAEEDRANALAKKDTAGVEQADKEIESLKNSINQLDKSMLELASQMQRTTPRDNGFISEFTQNTATGLGVGFAEIESQSEQIYTRLGMQLPLLFRDGLVDAMQAALDGSKSLEDSFRQIGITLLQSIQQAFLTSAANRITGAIGGIMGFNSGGYVNGGSGAKDDVPALLMGGEYVIKKSAVQKYGVNFLENLNRGALQGYAGGGAVLNIGGPKVAEREKYTDENEDGNVTRYRVKKAGVGIDSRLSAYAINNDRSIQKYFRDQEEQFNQDLMTKRQLKAREKNKKYREEMEKNALQNMLISAVGSAVIGKAISWGTEKFKQTDFYKNRQAKKIQKQFNKQGYADVKGQNIVNKYPNPRDRRIIQAQLKQTYADKGAFETAKLMQFYDLGGQVDSEGFDLFQRNNKGGPVVPSMLTGGEYVMSASAVKTYGSSLMQGLNSGTVATGTGAQAQSGQSGQVSNVSHGDVNININVDSSGAASGDADLNTPEFAQKVKSAVMNVLSQEKRVGGTLR
jgi:TP901 family phage tail tape measure protein